MKVRTLKPHGNRFGKAYDKAVGDEYEHPSPKAELTLGNVEDAGDDKATGNAGTGTQPVQSEGGDSKEQNAQSPKGKRRAGGAKNARSGKR